ncbi:hypothetical protein KY310_01290 [Candidatus Woesearchaeota archaeon]|nr:hypothetical protein [Candidatus Woesearchaeota archaeon]
MAKKKAKKKTKSKAKKKKAKKKSGTRKTRDTKKGYKIVQKAELALLELPMDDEEEEKKSPESSEEERYMEEFRRYIDEDEIEEEDIGEGDQSDAWGEDD